jgi:hypothetical protein
MSDKNGNKHKIVIYDDELDGFVFHTEVQKCVEGNFDQIRLCSFPTREQIKNIIDDPSIDTDNFTIGYYCDSIRGIWAYSSLGSYIKRVNTQYVFDIPSGPTRIIFRPLSRLFEN